MWYILKQVQLLPIEKKREDVAGSHVWSESHKEKKIKPLFFFMGNKASKLLTKAFNLSYRFTVQKKQKQNKTYQKKRKETEQNAGALAKKTKKKTKKQRRRRRNGLRPPVSCDGDSGYLVSISTGIFDLSFFFFFPHRPISFFPPKHTDFRPIQSDSARIGPV